MLAQIAGDVVQELLDVAVLDVEGRPGQPRLDLRGGVPGLGDQGRIVRAHPGGDQRDQAAEHGGGNEQGSPGRGEPGQPGPAQPGRERLQQGGEQQRRDARHDHDVQDAEHARDQVDGERREAADARTTRPRSAASPAPGCAQPCSRGGPAWSPGPAPACPPGAARPSEARSCSAPGRRRADGAQRSRACVGGHDRITAAIVAAPFLSPAGPVHPVAALPRPALRRPARPPGARPPRPGPAFQPRWQRVTADPSSPPPPRLHLTNYPRLHA